MYRGGRSRYRRGVLSKLAAAVLHDIACESFALCFFWEGGAL